jgi:hypothetical protein
VPFSKGGEGMRKLMLFTVDHTIYTVDPANTFFFVEQNADVQGGADRYCGFTVQISLFRFGFGLADHLVLYHFVQKRRPFCNKLIGIRAA